MKVIVLLCSLLLASDVIYGQINNDTIIIWNKNIKLNWTDFKGKPKDSTSYQVAWSYIEIHTDDYFEHNLPNYKVFPVFRKYDSWSKVNSMSVLIHEQLHFDIAEVYSRKMRKAINELREKKINTIDDYLVIFDNYGLECVQISNQYDKETAHGVYYNKQEQWNNKIAKELTELKDFEVNYLEYIKE